MALMKYANSNYKADDVAPQLTLIFQNVWRLTKYICNILLPSSVSLRVFTGVCVSGVKTFKDH